MVGLDLSFAGYWCEGREQTFFCHGLPLMTGAAICTQLCARRDLGAPYIYHHSQRVMIQASQGEAAQGPDISIFLLKSHSDLHTHTHTYNSDFWTGMTLAQSTDLITVSVRPTLLKYISIFFQIL